MKRSTSTALPHPPRTGHGRSRGRCLSMAKPAGSAGTGRGARPQPTRSTICANNSSRPTERSRLWSISTGASATRRSISTIKPSACSRWRPDTACSVRGPDAGPMRSRCAPRCRHWRIRTADTSRIAAAACRSAPIRTCISWRARSPGVRSTTTRSGGKWRTTSRNSASPDSSSPRPVRCESSSPPTGRPRPASKAVLPSRDTTMNGHTCWRAGPNWRAGRGPTRSAG